MMTSKALLSFLLIISSSFVHISLCENSSSSLDQLLPGLVQSAMVQDAQCMQKLLPCKPFLKSPSNPPPACCDPLSEVITKEADCLCGVINNPQMLMTFNVSKEDIMKLPGACDIKADVSKCKSPVAGDSSSSQDASSSSSSSSSSGDATEEETSEDSNGSTKMISPYGIIYFGVPGFVALLSTLVFSAY